MIRDFVDKGLNVILTKEEQELFEKEENRMYFGISGGHTCGDFANIIITDYTLAIDEDNQILFFDYEYGNDMDKWKNWGSGEFNRITKKFTYTD